MLKKVVVKTAVACTCCLVAKNGVVEYNNQKYYNPENIYPCNAIVAEVNYETDVVTFLDVDGEPIYMNHCEDWFEGDFAELILYNNGTVDETDDIVIKSLYNGNINQYEGIGE